MDRRRALALCGMAMLSATAGCLSHGGESTQDEESTPELPSPEHDGWPMAGYDAGNTGHHRTASLPSTEPDQRWTKSFEEIGRNTTPVVSEQQVYVGPTTERNPPVYLHQLAVDSGTVTREIDIGFRSNGQSPAVADETIYINTRPSSGTIAIEAFDTTDGSQQWEFELDDRAVAPLVVAGDRLFVTTAASVIALDRTDGTEHWRKDVSQETQPAVGNGAIHVVSDGSIHAYDWIRGDKQWEYELTGHESLTPTVRHGRVYAGDGTDIIALDDGEELWRTGAGDIDIHESELFNETDADPEELDLLGGAPAVDDSHVYVSRTGFLHAFDAETGVEQWTTAVWKMETTGSIIREPLTVVDGQVLIQLPSTIGAVDTTDGSIQWTVEVPRAATGRLAVIDGAIFAADLHGKLFVYGNSSEQ